jgi:hypothetical protein
MKIFEKMKALIISLLCFDKTEINRFGPISGGIFLTHGKKHKINYTLYVSALD